MYKFIAYSHPNITARHKSTLEFTKDNDLSLKGDCIIGVKANFKLSSLKKFIKVSNKIKVIIKYKINKKTMKEEILCEPNPNFNSDKEMVIRKSDFIDERTFGIKADKGAIDLDRKFIKYISKDMGKRINITIV
jgi:hypothetical protein